MDRLNILKQGNVQKFLESKSGKSPESTYTCENTLEDNKQNTSEDNSKNLLKGVFYKWLWVALIATFMAIMSILMDITVERLGNLKFEWLDSLKSENEGLSKLTKTFTVWVLFSVVMTLISVLVVRLLSYEAVGSGIPEIKTILRGIKLDGYFNFKTFITLMISLTLALSSGLPIGKAGPFVHLSSTFSYIISGFIRKFDKRMGSLQNEMVVAGSAIGLACTFGAPIGGVLFSIEVTSNYFAVQNYWMVFFGATVATTVFRLLRIALSLDIAVVSTYQTKLPQNCFFPEELPLFALIGLICGFGAAGFIVLHRKLVLFRRNNQTMKKIFDKHWIIYPFFVSMLISSFTYPGGFGNLIGGKQKISLISRDLFFNCIWSAKENSTYRCPDDILQSWLNGGNFYLILSVFTATFFVFTALAVTLPLPAGIFGPAFTVGSAFGRLIGEFMAITYPNGVRNNGIPVFPAVYSVVASAGFCGGITHTISTAVIAYELTGQLSYILPVLIAVIISNAFCSYFQPSIYDSFIELRQLPYLPSIPNLDNFNNIKVEQFMVSNIHFLTSNSTYRELRELLRKTDFRTFPIVECEETMILMGSFERLKLTKLLEDLIGSEARKTEARIRFRLSQLVYSVECRLRNNPTITAFKKMDKLEFDAEKADLHGNERRKWEMERLSNKINLDVMDPTPFQLNLNTSLLKTHSMFGLLGLSRAYVTNCGKLLGMVSITDLRIAIERVNSDILVPN